METIVLKIKRLGTKTPSAEAFKTALKKLLMEEGTSWNRQAKDNLLRLIEFDNKVLFEFSREHRVRLRTLTLLWQHLHGERPAEISAHFLMDLRRQFERLTSRGNELPDSERIRKWMRRWPDGLNADITAARKRNKERIIDYLVKRIERRRGHKNTYVFDEGLDDGQKRQQVNRWWNDYRFHLALAIRSPRELNLALGRSLSKETLALYRKAVDKGIPIFVTPYYLTLLSVGENGFDDLVIRSYVLYSKELVETFGNIKAWEREDRVTPGVPNAAGWLLPEGNNIHRRYPEVVILIPDSIGRSCGGLCASCQRMYDFQKGRLNFNFVELKPKESWNKKLTRLMTFLEEDRQIKDILITGGDALMSQNATLKHLLDEIGKMAIRKKRANAGRAKGEKYAEIERIRLGSRLPAYLPMRVTDDLVEILRDFKQKGALAGIKQFFIQTHFQSPLEITPEARTAIRKLQSAGWIVTNQHVYNVAASRRGHAAQLRRCLNAIDVVSYYTFTVKGFMENHAVYAPISRSMQERAEEKILGRMNWQEEVGLTHDLLKDPGSLSRYCRTSGHPFVASDRNVLNLPGIGKSMTFRLVGILPDGRRMLEFEHDRTRRHSPVISRFPKVYILENKSIGAYLEQLEQMGEKREWYESIWKHTEGETERRFRLFEYPGSEANFTEESENLASS
jgi:lysine 2,3-aminomutase